MRSVRDTGIVFPSTLSSDEKRLKEVFEKLRTIRKAIAATNKVNVGSTAGDNLKAERKTTKRHLQQAQEATEEVKRKVLIGAVSFKKADEKKDSFKRSSLVGRRRDSGKTKTDSDTTNNSNTDLLPLTADDSFDIYKPLSSDDHSGTQKKPEEPSDSFDTSKNFGTCKSTVSNVSGIRKSGSSSSSQKVSIDRTSSNSSDTSPASDSFDTYKTREGASAFDNYKPIGVGDSGNFDVSTPSSSFDIYKPTSIGDDGFDNYKPGSAQSSSFDANSGSLPFIGFEQRKACRGPCLYIRGYDLIADSLRNVFSKYGVINRVFVEERQKSAFITYATTEEAEVAIKEMDGNMVNGITLRVSFARRQNQCGDSGRFRSSKSFDRSNDDDDRSSGDRSNRFRSERSNRFRGNEHAHFRGEKRGRGRGRTCESGNFLLPAVSAENNDDFWSGASKVSSDERPTAEAPHDKDDFWQAGKRSPGKTSDRSSVERDNKEGDGFDTYKSTISASERDVDKKDDDFDTYKPFSNDGRSDSSNTCSRGTVDGENFGKRHSGLEHMGGERRGGFGNDKYRSFRGDRRGGGMPRRSNRSRGSLLWQSRKRSNELKGVDYCSTGNLDISHRSPWPTRADIGAKDDFWTSGDAHSKSDSDNRESELQEKGYGKSDFWPTSSHHSSSRGDESWPFSVEKSDGEQPLRGSTRGDHKSGRREGDRGGGFRRQPRDLDDKIVWPDDEEGKSSCCDGWPDVDSKPSPDSWPAPSDDKMPSSPPPPPPMSDVQVAWSEATKKTSKEMASIATEKEEITAMQRKPEIRTQVSYDEDDPFA